MDERPGGRPAVPIFLSQWRVRLLLGLCVAGGLTLWMFFVWRWRTSYAFLYNVPIFVVFGIWLTRAGGWLWQRRWGQLAVGASALAAVTVRLRSLDPSQTFPVSGHAVFLAYVLVSTRRDLLLICPAAAVLAQVAVIKVACHDHITLAAGSLLGLFFGLLARVLARRRAADGTIARCRAAE